MFSRLVAVNSIAILVLAMPVQAAGPFVVQPGDTLWSISSRVLGSPWCWKLIASIPENEIDFQGVLPAGKTLQFGFIENDCKKILNPVIMSTPIETSTVGYFPHQPWAEGGNRPETFIEKEVMSEAEKASRSHLLQTNYDQMWPTHKYEDLYRERDGDKWYVIANGVRGSEWDYVDMLRKNDDTGSVFYRARDLEGQWYVVKNEQATLLDFEPFSLYYDVNDEPVAISTETLETPAGSGHYATLIYTPAKRMRIPGGGYRLEAMDSEGNLLLRRTLTVPVHGKGMDGQSVDVKNSTLHSQDSTYYVNDHQIGHVYNRMVPLYTDKPTAVRLHPAAFGTDEVDEQAMAYYGVFNALRFDEEDRIVLYSFFDTNITKQVFDVK